METRRTRRPGAQAAATRPASNSSSTNDFRARTATNNQPLGLRFILRICAAQANLLNRFVLPHRCLARIGSARSQRINTELLQQGAQLDQRQTDECRWVVAVNAGE
jgi:hypothetical protein